MMNPFEIMKNVQKIQEKTALIKCSGYALGDKIEVVATGDMKIESVRIDPSLVKEGQEQMLEVLLASAVNSAFDNVKQRLSQEVGGLAGQYGLNL